VGGRGRVVGEAEEDRARGGFFTRLPRLPVKRFLPRSQSVNPSESSERKQGGVSGGG